MTGGPLPGDNVPPSDFVTSDTFLPPLIIEPFGVSDTGSMMQAQYYGQPDSISSSCSSHASGSMDGNSVGGWPESPVRYSAQTSQAGRSDSMFGAHLPHSPYTTPQNSPCTTRDDEIRDNDEFRFRTPLDSLHGFTVSNFEFSPGLSPFGRNTTPDHVDTGMAIDWTQQSVGQYHQNPCPSVSAPSTPHMGPMISASQLQQQFQAMPIPDSESSSSSSSLSSSSLPRNPGSHLLAVPPSDKFRAPRRYSDPPQPSFQPSSPSWSPAATGFGRDRPRSPNYSTTQGSARPPGVKKASVYKALPAAAPKSSVIARRKGVRTSCLPEETKVQARKTRNERTMCLSCRLSKVKVRPSGPLAHGRTTERTANPSSVLEPQRGALGVRRSPSTKDRGSAPRPISCTTSRPSRRASYVCHTRSPMSLSPPQDTDISSSPLSDLPPAQ